MISKIQFLPLKGVLKKTVLSLSLLGANLGYICHLIFY
ncbi:hypothetical protein MNB_SUP05-SYMBIONT-5-882 [hydrothermal vent metagenome]|uniref:Uncharacterized protein n=1 Tax=hydrothermal vent metagenome TaxID=652676 RepID=A0A1W1E0Y1_9ZZZZ